MLGQIIHKIKDFLKRIRECFLSSIIWDDLSPALVYWINFETEIFFSCSVCEY